jgi:hypothetical protein
VPVPPTKSLEEQPKLAATAVTGLGSGKLASGSGPNNPTPILLVPDTASIVELRKVAAFDWSSSLFTPPERLSTDATRRPVR